MRTVVEVVSTFAVPPKRGSILPIDLMSPKKFTSYTTTIVNPLVTTIDVTAMTLLLHPDPMPTSMHFINELTGCYFRLGTRRNDRAHEFWVGEPIRLVLGRHKFPMTMRAVRGDSLFIGVEPRWTGDLDTHGYEGKVTLELRLLGRERP